MSDFKEGQQKILENQQYIIDRLEYLCERARAQELTGADSTLINIPWNSVAAVLGGLDSNVKERAFLRLCLSPVVAPSKVHYVAQMCDALFTPDFRGRTYLRKPTG